MRCRWSTLAWDRLDANPLAEIKKLRSSRTPVLAAILAQRATIDKRSLAHSGAILALNRDSLLNHRGRSLAFLEVGGAASQSQPASKPAKKLEQP